jgi:acyl dehydratase
VSARDGFAEIHAGLELPPLVRVPTRAQLVRYAGAADDYSPIHFDDDNARERGFDSVIVHGLLKAAFLGELLETWSADRGGWVQAMRTEYRGVDRPGSPIVCRARVDSTSSAGSTGFAELSLWVERADGSRSTQGSATIRFDLDEESA